MPDEQETVIDLADVLPQQQPQVQYPIFGVDVQPHFSRLIVHHSAGSRTAYDIPEDAMDDWMRKWKERHYTNIDVLSKQP